MRVRLESDDFIDEIRITTVPRFKTSGLSGDEWRWGFQCEALRKGRLVKEVFVNDMKYAQAMMATGIWWTDDEAIPEPRLTEDLCDQPGCREPWTVLYRLIKRGCGRCGSTDRYVGDDYFRAFCDRHARRGNSNLDDSDDNYEMSLRKGPAQDDFPVREEDKSPSVFGGVIKLEDLP